MSRRLYVLAGALFNFNASAAGMTADLLFAADVAQHNDSSQYDVPDSVLALDDRGYELNLELHWQKGGFNTTATLRQRLLSEGGSDFAAFFNELYYDTQIGTLDVSLGRKIASWGVSFGYRPLDVIQQEDRRALYTNTLKGIDMLALETYGERSALSLLWTNPGRGQAAKPELDESLALKLFYNLGDMDLHALVRYSQRNKTQLGAGFSRVSGEALEWHGSVLWQQTYKKSVNRLTMPGASTPLSAENPFVNQSFSGGIKALAGVSWTHASGWNVLAEIWYDETAYTDQQWHDLNALNSTQRGLFASSGLPATAILSNIAWNHQAFRQDNLRQWNTLLRLSRQGGSFEPSLDLLYTPADSGWVATAGASYTLNKQRFEVGLRYIDGNSESALAQLPNSGQAFISWRASF